MSVLVYERIKWRGKERDEEKKQIETQQRYGENNYWLHKKSISYVGYTSNLNTVTSSSILTHIQQIMRGTELVNILRLYRKCYTRKHITMNKQTYS